MTNIRGPNEGESNNPDGGPGMNDMHCPLCDATVEQLAAHVRNDCPRLQD